MVVRFVVSGLGVPAFCFTTFRVALFLVSPHAKKIRNQRPCLFKMADEKMKNLLSSIGLITLYSKFQEEKVDFNVILPTGD